MPTKIISINSFILSTRQPSHILPQSMFHAILANIKDQIALNEFFKKLFH